MSAVGRAWAALRGPAGYDPGVAAGELGIELSDELRDWFALHDGAESFHDGQVLPFNTVLSLPDAVDSVLLSREIWWRDEIHDHVALDRRPAGTVAGSRLPSYVYSYVYIGQDGMGGGLFVDLRSGSERGCVRFWDKVEADLGRVAAPSITDLLGTVRGAILAGGGDVAGWTPTVEDGRLDWGVSGG